MSKEFVNQLLEQGTFSTDSSKKWVSIDEIEKIVKAVVLECTNIVNSLEQHEGNSDCEKSSYIKEHFGV